MKNLTTMKRANVAFAAAAALIGLSTSSHAVLVAPGNLAVALSQGSFVAGSTLFSSIPTTNFTTQAGITGTFSQLVYAEPIASSPFGHATLDFYYRFTITTGSVGSSSTLSFGNVGNGFSTDVSFLDTAGTNPLNAAFVATSNAFFNPTSFTPTPFDPATVSRPVSGELDFTFPTLIETGASFVILVKTNATTDDQSGALNVLGTGVANAAVFEPAGLPVPEPTTAFFGLALLGGVVVARKRKTQTQALELSAI